MSRFVLALSLVLAVPALAAAQPRGGGSHTGGSHTGGGGAHGGGSHGGGATESAPDTFSTDYTAASHAWHEGRYEEALAGFRALHASSGRPELLYDIGVTCERLDRFEEAIEAFEAYVEALPLARNRMQVETRVASLRDDIRARDERTATTIAPGTATTIAPEAERTTRIASDRPIMTLMGQPSPIAEPEPVPFAVPPRTETVIEGGGPEWVVTWPFLVLTLASVIATPIAWDQGYQALAELEAYCLEANGCYDEEISGSSAKSWETATNALLVTSFVLGAATLIAFIAEAATPTARRAVERPVALRLDAGPGGLSLSGVF